MESKKTLLEKYAIPIEHLDFDYIERCQNVRELEKMVKILRSGEEGYYPDLTKYAEAKLDQIDSNNRLLQTEDKCQRTSMDDKQELNEFMETLKIKHKKLKSAENNESKLPPIRVQKKPTTKGETVAKPKPNRITSCEYEQWDTYDADAECMKIDLDEEIRREKAIAEQKCQQTSKLIEVMDDDSTLLGLSDVEKQEFADKHRIKGNEFFKSNEFRQAIAEYTNSLEYAKTAATYNNRALVHLKQNMFAEALADCDACLELEPRNLKAMFRKCDALVATDRKHDAFKLYSHILSFDPGNGRARKAMNGMSLRLPIEDINIPTQDENNSSPKRTESKSLLDQDVGDAGDIYKKLIIPKNIRPSNLSNAMSTVKQFMNSDNRFF